MNDKKARKWNAESWDALTADRDRLASQLATEERASAYMGEQYNEAVTRLGAAEASLQEATRLLEEYRRWRLAGQHVGVMAEMLALDAGVENFLTRTTLPGEAAPTTTQTGPTCGECGSLLIPQSVGNFTDLRCVNCESREAQPSEGTAKP